MRATIGLHFHFYKYLVNSTARHLPDRQVRYVFEQLHVLLEYTCKQPDLTMLGLVCCVIIWIFILVRACDRTFPYVMKCSPDNYTAAEIDIV